MIKDLKSDILRGTALEIAVEIYTIPPIPDTYASYAMDKQVT